MFSGYLFEVIYNEIAFRVKKEKFVNVFFWKDELFSKVCMYVVFIGYNFMCCVMMVVFILKDEFGVLCKI